MGLEFIVVSSSEGKTFAVFVKEGLESGQKQPRCKSDEQNVEYEGSEIPLAWIQAVTLLIKQGSRYNVINMQQSCSTNLLGAILE